MCSPELSGKEGFEIQDDKVRVFEHEENPEIEDERERGDDTALFVFIFPAQGETGQVGGDSCRQNKEESTKAVRNIIDDT